MKELDYFLLQTAFADFSYPILLIWYFPEERCLRNDSQPYVKYPRFQTHG